MSSSKIKPLTAIGILFLFSRMIFVLLGICFDITGLTFYWQYIDPVLLKNNLLQSVYYLHSQPPLFNLFLGIVLKIFPNNPEVAFKFIYLLFGLILSTCLFLLMARLGVSEKLSAVLTGVFILSPACILYENWLFYTYPVAVLLCLAALFLHKFLSDKRLRDGVLFFSLLSVIGLTRSVFHLIWFVLFWLMLIFYQRVDWKKIVLAGAVPFFIFFLLYAKNLYTFGSFSGSSWLGMSLAKLTINGLPEAERNSLVKQGKLSKISRVKPFERIAKYPEEYLLPKTDIAVLDQKITSTKENNLNNIAYIGISKQYLKDAVYVLKHYPTIYIKNLVKSFAYYFLPPDTYWFLDYNAGHIKNWVKIYHVVFYGKLFPHDKAELTALQGKGDILGYFKALFSIGIFSIIVLPFLAFYGILLLVKRLSNADKDLPFVLTVAFICINVLYVTLLGNALEVGENQRFRFLIEPLFLVLLGVFLTYKFKRINELSVNKLKTGN